jgi:hypothetical protein
VTTGDPNFSHEPPIFWPHKPRSPRFSSAVASSDRPNRRWCRHLQRTRSERVHLRPRKAKDVVICMYSMYVCIYIYVYYIYGHPPTTHRHAVFTGICTIKSGICTIKSGIYSIKSYKISSFLVQFVLLQDHIPIKKTTKLLIHVAYDSHPWDFCGCRQQSAEPQQAARHGVGGDWGWWEGERESQWLVINITILQYITINNHYNIVINMSH